MALLIIVYIFFLVISFLIFDRIVSHEYKIYGEDYLRDGKPYGLLSGAPESGRIFSFFYNAWGQRAWVGKTLYCKWLFVTPSWAKEDKKVLNKFLAMRLFFLISIVNFVIGFFFVFFMPHLLIFGHNN